jgi:hypothetical protein
MKESLDQSATRALEFLADQDRPVEHAWIGHLLGSQPRDAVIAALAAYQNSDGGFGKGFEVDIKAPGSQAFATRMAMLVLISIGASRDKPIVKRLAAWLEGAQAEDGDWHFSPDIYQYELAPWFAGWTFPSLNPALCLAGAAMRLGIGSDRLHTRVRRLADQLASAEQVATADFYALLPYVEYFPWVEGPRQDEMLTAIAVRIGQIATDGGYDDAGHFFDHLGPANGELARRVSPAIIRQQLDRLHAEQQPDGGWPTPYDQSWRPWATANAIIALRDDDRAIG